MLSGGFEANRGRLPMPISGGYRIVSHFGQYNVQLGNATDDDIKKMEQIARNVGLAFQIQDDILDVTSTTEELGKPVLSDDKNHKTTYVTLMGIDDAKKKVEDYSNDALNLLDELNYKNEFLNNLINELINRKK